VGKLRLRAKIAPIDVIDRVVQLLITKEIVNYRYDAIHEEVVER